MQIVSRGKLLGIATRAAERAPMQEVSSAEITLEAGVDRDSRGKQGRRQITVLTRDAWNAACSDVGADLPWTTRRANLFVEGIDLEGTVGYGLRVGSAVVRISGETKPCQRMNEAYPGLMSALKSNWRGGVTGYVISAGRAEVGCEVQLIRDRLRQFAVISYERSRGIAKRARDVLLEKRDYR